MLGAPYIWSHNSIPKADKRENCKVNGQNEMQKGMSQKGQGCELQILANQFLITAKLSEQMEETLNNGLSL